MDNRELNKIRLRLDSLDDSIRRLDNDIQSKFRDITHMGLKPRLDSVSDNTRRISNEVHDGFRDLRSIKLRLDSFDNNIRRLFEGFRSLKSEVRSMKREFKEQKDLIGEIVTKLIEKLEESTAEFTQAAGVLSEHAEAISMESWEKETMAQNILKMLLIMQRLPVMGDMMKEFDKYDDNPPSQEEKPQDLVKLLEEFDRENG